MRDLNADRELGESYRTVANWVETNTAEHLLAICVTVRAWIFETDRLKQLRETHGR